MRYVSKAKDYFVECQLLYFACHTAQLPFLPVKYF